MKPSAALVQSWPITTLISLRLNMYNNENTIEEKVKNDAHIWELPPHQIDNVTRKVNKKKEEDTNNSSTRAWLLEQYQYEDESVESNGSIRSITI